ncbi:hypothetical protein RQP46_004620 [Phenoliferia psychrophenolica]
MAPPLEGIPNYDELIDTLDAVPTLTLSPTNPTPSDKKDLSTPTVYEDRDDEEKCSAKEEGSSEDVNGGGDWKDTVELTPLEAIDQSVEGDQSPFPEVAACVPNTDDPTIEVNNFRLWVLLTMFVILFAGVNQFFSLRYPSLSIGYVVAQLLVFPVGKAWEKLPTWRVGYGKVAFRLNPGKFSIKEHAVITIVSLLNDTRNSSTTLSSSRRLTQCVNLTGSTAYAMGSLVAITSKEFWGRDYGAGFGFCYLLTSQALGFGFAGLARRWIVYPAALIWPSTLTSTVLFRALHEKEDRISANGWTMSRYKFFGIFTAGSFVWFWFPDYLCTCLSSFAFLTWIWPKNQRVNAIFGMSSGIGLLPISFDWTVISYAGAPLTTPFYVTANCFASVLLFFVFIGPIFYYTNVWNSAYLPMLTSTTYDNTGTKYNVTRVVSNNLDFDLAKYKAYSPMYISESYSFSYGLNFAAVTAIVFHTLLYNRKDIIAKFKDSRSGGEDIHKRLMRSYKDVPDWWYWVFTAVIVGLGIFTIRYWDTQLPVWGFIVVVCGFPALLMIPEGILEGTTNQRVFLNIITELVAGYAWPGRPIANMMVKMYGYNSIKHGLDFAQDLKLGQYMHIAPRLLFWAQMYSTVLSAATQVGVLRWMLGNIEDLCSSTNTQRFTCAGTKVVYNASVIWGTIGPQRMFQSGQTYNGLMHFFWIGPVCVVIFYFLFKRWPQSWLRYVNLPIFFNSAGNIPPANVAMYSLWFITGYIFNYLIRKRAFGWWKRYNYLLSASLDTGVALATIIIFFALSYNNIKLVWGGNTIGNDTADTKGTPWLTVAKGQHFGPGVGEF